MIILSIRIKPKGTGMPVLKTKKYIKDNYFLMLLPDDLIIKKTALNL
jgi:UTP--glucose-1-phosphate uridylyltransferase